MWRLSLAFLANERLFLLLIPALAAHLIQFVLFRAIEKFAVPVHHLHLLRWLSVLPQELHLELSLRAVRSPGNGDPHIVAQKGYAIQKLQLAYALKFAVQQVTELRLGDAELLRRLSLRPSVARDNAAYAVGKLLFARKRFSGKTFHSHAFR